MSLFCNCLLLQNNCNISLYILIQTCISIKFCIQAEVEKLFNWSSSQGDYRALLIYKVWSHFNTKNLNLIWNALWNGVINIIVKTKQNKSNTLETPISVLYCWEIWRVQWCRGRSHIIVDDLDCVHTWWNYVLKSKLKSVGSIFVSCSIIEEEDSVTKWQQYLESSPWLHLGLIITSGCKDFKGLSK